MLFLKATGDFWDALAIWFFSLGLMYALGKPWVVQQKPQVTPVKLLFLAFCCTFLGFLVPWLWPWALMSVCLLEALLGRFIQGYPDSRRLLLFFLFIAFPWLQADGGLLGLFFRLSGAQVVENALNLLQIPVARTGVHLMLGSGVSLYVEAACSGLNTLSLMLLCGGGVVYHLWGKVSWVGYGCGLLLLLPLAWVANTVRLFSVALVAHYFGEATAANLWHGIGGGDNGTRLFCRFIRAIIFNRLPLVSLF